jgi:hypothetical protein
MALAVSEVCGHEYLQISSKKDSTDLWCLITVLGSCQVRRAFALISLIKRGNFLLGPFKAFEGKPWTPQDDQRLLELVKQCPWHADLGTRQGLVRERERE